MCVVACPDPGIPFFAWWTSHPLAQCFSCPRSFSVTAWQRQHPLRFPSLGGVRVLWSLSCFGWGFGSCLFSKCKCWEVTAAAGGGCAAEIRRGCSGLPGLEGRKLLLEGATLSSLHLAGVITGVSVMGAPQRSFLFGAKLWEDPQGKDKRLCALAIICSFSGSSCLATLGLCPPASGFLSQQEDRRWLETHNRESRQGRTDSSPSWPGKHRKKGPEDLQAWIGLSCWRGDWAETQGVQVRAETSGGHQPTKLEPLFPKAEDPETAPQAKTSFHKILWWSSSLYNIFILPNGTGLTMSCAS